jgi:hypothetical protein
MWALFGFFKTITLPWLMVNLKYILAKYNENKVISLCNIYKLGRVIERLSKKIAS